MLTHTYYMVGERAQHNGGAKLDGAFEGFGDDGALIASLLHRWGLPAGLACTALGDDDVGRRVAKQITALGIPGELRVLKGLETEREVCVADPSGARTFWQQRNPEVLATLATADLSMLEGARLLYVDWYDGEPVQRAMEEAVRLGVPVYFNVESHYDDEELVRRLAPLATFCQVSLDEPGAEGGDLAARVAESLLVRGISTAIVTRGSGGCLVSNGSATAQCGTPDLPVVDGGGAGAAFSAGFIFAHFQGWSIEKCARFATATGSLKCTKMGFDHLNLVEIEGLSASISAT
jgi:sugar/nucleoside kinase (ribokinase family)